MANNFGKLTDSQLLLALGTMINGLDGNVAAYGMTAADLSALETDAGNFNTSVEGANLAEAARKTATENKRNRRSSALSRINNFARRIYGTPTVTDTQLAAVGLAPRQSGGTRQSPKQPLDFVVTPGTETQAEFKWRRNSNPSNAIFAIQQWTTLGWTNIALTNKTKVNLTGFPVGVEAQFRVISQVNQEQSLPSNTFVIWPGQEDSLSIAA